MFIQNCVFYSKFDKGKTLYTNVPVREIKTHVRRSYLAVLEASIRPIRNPIARKAYRVHIFRCLSLAKKRGERREERRGGRERERRGEERCQGKGRALFVLRHPAAV